jgi:predicted short-subunit dehydrogenase-like oxidoreductase (DUF2520 family)
VNFKNAPTFASMKAIQTICIIGAGNVAAHLGKGLHDAGIEIKGIYSKTEEKARALALQVNSEVFRSITELPPSDLYLICVNDDQIEQVVGEIPQEQAFAYTSGTVQLHDFNKHGIKGVFYPLQSFSTNRSIALFNVPFFIEGHDTDFAQALFDLAWKISRTVRFASSEERKKIHVAAVMVNNFTNHLVFLANEFMEKNLLDASVLKPLLTETVEKLLDSNPYEAQTGPARRGDKGTVAAHLSLLEGKTKALYDLLSQSIMEHYPPNI